MMMPKGTLHAFCRPFIATKTITFLRMSIPAPVSAQGRGMGVPKGSPARARAIFQGTGVPEPGRPRPYPARMNFSSNGRAQSGHAQTLPPSPVPFRISRVRACPSARARYRTGNALGHTPTSKKSLGRGRVKKIRQDHHGR